MRGSPDMGNPGTLILNCLRHKTIKFQSIAAIIFVKPASGSMFIEELMMAIVTRPLSAAEIQKAKPAAKPYMLFDGRGLCLQIKPNGKKYWRYRYTRPATGKSTDISLGLYPDISLANARLEHQKYLALLAKGIDPKALEREAQQQVKIAEETRFGVVAKKWHNTKKGKVSEQHHAQIWSSLENNVPLHIKNCQPGIPSIGNDVMLFSRSLRNLCGIIQPTAFDGLFNFIIFWITGNSWIQIKCP